MKQVLCFGDSNTFGSRPGWQDAAEARFDRDTRWPGVVAAQLGSGWHIVEEGLGGRTTVFDDPATTGRNGSKWLVPCLQSHQPLDALVIMLGTNDVKTVYAAPVLEIGRGIELLVQLAQNPVVYDTRKPPKILIVSPAHIGEDIEQSWLYDAFDTTSVEKSRRLAKEYARIAGLYGCSFLDAATVAKTMPGEAVHLDESSHCALGEAVAQKLRELLP